MVASYCRAPYLVHKNLLIVMCKIFKGLKFDKIDKSTGFNF